MIKIWLLLMIISMPNEKSVRYNNKLKSEAFCIPFDSFPITGLQAPIGA